MKQVPATGSNDDDRTTAVGLARYAFEYIEAALLVDEHDADARPGNQISPVPAYFLALHGIELTLKSYLRHQGVPLRELRSKKYGHDVHACYRKSKELGLLHRFSEQTADVDGLRLLIDLNNDHGLRYIKTGSKQFPLWSLVAPLAVRLHQAVAPLVGCKTFTSAFGGYPPSL